MGSPIVVETETALTRLLVEHNAVAPDLIRARGRNVIPGPQTTGAVRGTRGLTVRSGRRLPVRPDARCSSAVLRSNVISDDPIVNRRGHEKERRTRLLGSRGADRDCEEDSYLDPE